MSRSSTPGAGFGAFSSYTLLGPPESTMPWGFSCRMRSRLELPGRMTLYAPSSRNRRAIRRVN